MLLRYKFEDEPKFVIGLLEYFFGFEIGPWCCGGYFELMEEEGKPGHYQFLVKAPNRRLSSHGQVTIGAGIANATVIFEFSDQLPNSLERREFESEVRSRIDGLMRLYDLTPA